MPTRNGAQVAQAEPVEVLTVKDYKSGDKPVWCPGCGDFGVLSATVRPTS
jgi:2-oxoglutarate ferredoxin oxidoreductase subunit beta